MTVLTFENQQETPLTIVVEPAGDAHQVPHLATAGVRYAPKEGGVDRTNLVVSDGRIELWCDADHPEVDIVYPTAFDLLIWEICVVGGWCGGIVEDQPTTVNDLLPDSGAVTAQEFARLVILADGCTESEPHFEKWRRWLEMKFIERLGSEYVDARMLRPSLARPFENA